MSIWCKVFRGVNKVLRQLIKEIVCENINTGRENEKWWAQFGAGPEDFTTTVTVAPKLDVEQGKQACVYCAGTGMRDVGSRTIKCDICDGTGKVDAS